MLRWRAGLASGAAVAAVLAGATGCQDDPAPADLSVVTPPPSATAGAPSGTGPAGTGGARTSPPGPPAGGTTSGPGPSAAGGALAAYQGLVADRQRSRSALFAAVSDGTPRTVAAQRQLAATHLAELRRFAARVRAAVPTWPAPARAAAADLLAAGDRQRATVERMAGAASAGAFTAALADYGVGVAAEERATRAVLRALGG